MNSILNGRPLLREKVYEVAKVASFLWQKGWAERNGGNITVNITDQVDEAMRLLPAISPAQPIGCDLPLLEGCWFYCKGTGKRMRDLGEDPMKGGSIIRVLKGGSTYEIVADEPVRPTSELPSHLMVHEWFIKKGLPYKASLHTHPIDLVAMSHARKFLAKDVLTNLLWSMIPETKAFCPKGLGVVAYQLPGSLELARGTMEALEDYDVVLWEKHGVFAVDTDIMSCFDQVDVLSKAAQIYISARQMGFEPEGMSQQQMHEMSVAFHLPK